MVDPLSIATASLAISKATCQISLTLYNYINATKNVDQRVRSLRGEIDSLTQLLDSVTTAVSNPIIKSASAATPESFELLGSIGEVLSLCQASVEALDGALKSVFKEPNSKNLFKRSVRAIKLNLNSDDIAQFQSEIHVHSTHLQMALQTINLLVSCLSPDRIVNDIVPRIEQLTHMVMRMNRTRISHTASQAGYHTADVNSSGPAERLRQSAETILSSAMTVAGGHSTIWGGSERNYVSESVNGEPLTQETRDQIHSWIAVPKVDKEATDSFHPSDNRHEAESSRSSQTLNPTNFSAEEMFQSFRINENPPKLSLPECAVNSGGAEIYPDDDSAGRYESENEIEFEITQRLLHKFLRLCIEGHPAKAEPILQKVFQTAKKLSLRQREVLEIQNTRFTLAKGFLIRHSQLCSEGRLLEAEQALEQALKISEKIDLTQRESLEVENAKLTQAKMYLHKVSQLCSNGNALEAENGMLDLSRLLETLAVEARKAIDFKAAELSLAKVFLNDGRLEEAERILFRLAQEFAVSDDDAIRIIDASHALAQAYTLNLKFDAAREICARSIAARRKLLGRDHNDYFRSLSLMSCIYEAGGDDITAEAYQELIPHGWRENSDDDFTKRLYDTAELKRKKEEAEKKKEETQGLARGATRRTLNGHSGSVLAMMFSPDGRLLASAGGDSTVRVWDSATGAACRTLKGHSGSVWAVALSPDGRLLASAGDDGTVRVWGPATGAACRRLKGHSGSVLAVSFSPDGRLLVSAGDDRTVRFWDLATGAACRTLKGHSGSVLAVAFSPDGRLLVSAGHDRTVRVWDLATGAACRTLKGHSGSVVAVAFSPDGRLLASAGGDGTFRVWDSATGAACRTLKGHSGSVVAVAFSPDGRLLVSAGRNGTVKVWDPATGAAYGTLKGHSGSVVAVSFSPDGRLLASAGGDGTVRVWDSATGAACRTLKGHSGSVVAVSFSPDCRLLASAGDDGTVRLWDSAMCVDERQS